MFKCLDDQEASLGGTREHKKTDGAGAGAKIEARFCERNFIQRK